METTCENHCPECNSENIDWQSKDFIGNQICQDAECQDCNCLFTEWWAYSKTTFTFSKTTFTL